MFPQNFGHNDCNFNKFDDLQLLYDGGFPVTIKYNTYLRQS